MSKTDSHDMLDVLAHEAGLGAAASDAPMTRDELRDADDLLAFARGELARQARADIAPAALVARPVRPSILSMSRDALLARLSELRLMPSVRLAASHRHFAGTATENDLRTALEDLEALIDRVGDPR